MNYYNELDPYAAQWIRNLIAKGLIPNGKVDTRDIRKVKAKEVQGYIQAHFFAGIAGWSYALQLAGWPEDEEVWTGSCPCQPFSIAGKGKGKKDKRHLWPVWRDIIAECMPSVIFGEQVASPLGRDWLAGVRIDMEALGYEVGAADLCAAGIGAPHIRQRLFWVADAQDTNRERKGQARNAGRRTFSKTRRSSVPGGLVNAKSGGTLPAEQQGPLPGCQQAGSGDCGLGNTSSRKLAGRKRKAAQKECPAVERASSTGASFWRNYELVHCADGKARRIKSRSFPLAFKLPRSVGQNKSWLEAMGFLAKAAEALTGAKRNRVGRLKGYGNAIVTFLAAEFITAYLEARRLDHG